VITAVAFHLPGEGGAVTTIAAVQTFYDAIGGEATIRGIVARFFERVAADEILMAQYPADDLPAAEERLALFLMQRWGGPTTYSDERGHPRLRMRHVPFAIGPAERDAWLRAMRPALEEAALAEEHRDELWSYLETTAHSMQNRPG
jgi:hemoglobin